LISILENYGKDYPILKCKIGNPPACFQKKIMGKKILIVEHVVAIQYDA